MIHNRKSAPKVVNGVVQFQNNWSLSSNHVLHKERYPVIHKEKSSVGYKHVLTKTDLINFINILPDWEELSSGLKSIILAKPDDDCFGWHYPGEISICAWPKKLHMTFCKEGIEEDGYILEALYH